MKVFKFGGASVKDAASIRNVAHILSDYKQEELVIVVSALGKTTNALEAIMQAYVQETGHTHMLINQLKRQHFDIVKELFGEKAYSVQADLRDVFTAITERVQQPAVANHNFIYDQIVSAGELLSTKIVSAYLSEQGIANVWLDVRTCIRTDNTYREGQIDWQVTRQQIQNKIPMLIDAPMTGKQFVVTQGFLGGTIENFTTTLGREGSDYTAAIFANSLNATEMCVWKDVPGILTGDPRLLNDVVKIPQLSYHEAIEMTYYGAKVIHPKTIKPLQNKQIPLHVRSFKTPKVTGTIINHKTTSNLPPVVVIMKKQLLLKLTTKDFSFMSEGNLSNIYQLLAEHRIKTNLTQNEAISFMACIDNVTFRVQPLLAALGDNYQVETTDNLTLITIRHYDAPTIEKQTENKNVVLQQQVLDTFQAVIK